MVHQPSSWELSLDRAKQEFRDHQQPHCPNDPKGSDISALSNSTQNIFGIRTSEKFEDKQHESHINNTPYDSCRVPGVINVAASNKNGVEYYNNSCSAQNRDLKRVDQVQQISKPFSNSIKAISMKDASTVASHKYLNAALRDIMVRHLGLDIKVKNQNEPLPFKTTHTRTLSESSRPSLSSSFASTASTGITTPVLDNNQFNTLTWNEAISSIQPISMPKNLREQEFSAMSSRDGLTSNEYQEHEKVDDPALEFVPSAMLEGKSRLSKPEMARKAADVGIALNPNYKGELTNFNLRNAMCLDHENCSVRIHEIPPEANYSEIFAVVTHGKVFSFNYVPPMKGVFTHAAVDLVFLTREAAEGFFYDANFGRGLFIRGQRIVVLWNRVKVLPAEGRYEKMSRVVRIKGPAEDFSVTVLLDFFRNKFEFNLIAGKEWIQWDGKKIVELEFSSIRSQSESAMKSFKLYVDQNMPNAGYHIWYAPDPCFNSEHGGGSRL